MDKNKARKILFECAELYKDNLINRSLLFLCLDKHKNISALEVAFSTTGFMHLTGVKFKEQRLSAGEFFDKCINKRLSIEEFEMASDGTTEMKLNILPLLFVKNLSANMVGDFSARTPVLVTEKLAGGVKGCIGFVYDTKYRFYVPNTVLNLDIRTYITNQQRIIATFRKQKNDDAYQEIVYLAKKIDWEHLRFPELHVYLRKLISAKENGVVAAKATNVQ